MVAQITMTSGIIRHKDIQPDDWIAIYDWQLKYALVLNCEIGRSYAAKVYGNVPSVRGTPARYVRRKDHAAVIALQQCISPIFYCPVYAFPATDTDIEIVDE